MGHGACHVRYTAFNRYYPARAWPVPMITLSFARDLGTFLPYAWRKGEHTLTLADEPSVKDVIEARGVPHTEVGAILINGADADFNSRVHDGDRIRVFAAYARSEPADAPPPGTPWLQPAPPDPPRFVLDVHLGRLASYLRLLGFDTWYTTAADDADLATAAAVEGRILLTRDVGLLKRGNVRHGAFVYATDPLLQAEEVVRRFGLASRVAPFTRCLRCNGPLLAVAREEVEGHVPPQAWRTYDEYWRCGECGQVYWRGTHVARLAALVWRLSAGRPGQP